MPLSDLLSYVTGQALHAEMQQFPGLRCQQHAPSRPHSLGSARGCLAAAPLFPFAQKYPAWLALQRAQPPPLELVDEDSSVGAVPASLEYRRTPGVLEQRRASSTGRAFPPLSADTDVPKPGIQGTVRALRRSQSR